MIDDKKSTNANTNSDDDFDEKELEYPNVVIYDKDDFEMEI